MLLEIRIVVSITRTQWGGASGMLAMPVSCSTQLVQVRSVSENSQAIYLWYAYFFGLCILCFNTNFKKIKVKYLTKCFSQTYSKWYYAITFLKYNRNFQDSYSILGIS